MLSSNCTVIWEKKVVLPVEFMPQGTAIPATSYYRTWEILRNVIKKERCSIFSATDVFLHDNTNNNTVSQMCQLLELFKWEVLDLPPYSLGLPPNYYRLSLNMKKLMKQWTLGLTTGGSFLWWRNFEANA